MYTKEQSEVKNVVENLIEAGCNYNLVELEKFYSKTLKIIILQDNKEVLSFNYEQNMDFFRNLRDSDAPPINKQVEFNLIDVDKKYAYVIVTRFMNLGKGLQDIVFNLMLEKVNNQWKIYREHAIIL